MAKEELELGGIKINPTLTHKDAKCATMKSIIEESSLALSGPVMGTQYSQGDSKGARVDGSGNDKEESLQCLVFTMC